jgi:DNA invertase Pin-like site-specific DNA recombinase
VSSNHTASLHTHTYKRHLPALHRAIGYVRVSTEEQAREGISLDAQETRLRAYCTAKEIELLEVVRDEGLSGKDLKRPGLGRLVAACQEGDVEGVVVTKLDRLTRRTRDLLFLVEDIFQVHQVALHSLYETIDTSTASGRFFLRIMGALAEMERELISERTVAALAHKKANGERLGAVPLGFRLGNGNGLEPVPEELVSVRRLLGLWRVGWSYRRIADKLNEEGLQTQRGGRWYHTTVAKVVRRQAEYEEVLGAI